MFTRLKTQRNGFKLSLNNIKDSSVSRVVALNASTNTQNGQSHQHNHIEQNKNIDLIVNVDNNNNNKNNNTQIIDKITLLNNDDSNEFIDENHINFIKTCKHLSTKPYVIS
jgi:hypothetical protein